MSSARRAAVALAWAAAAAAVLLASTAAELAHEGDLWRNQPRRFWEDLGLARGLYLFGAFPVSYHPFAKFRGADGRLGYTEARPTYGRAAKVGAIRSWQFWSTGEDAVFRLRRPAPVFPRFDDAGRALLLGLLFRARGGIMPYLPFWIGTLLAVPALLWLATELGLAGRGVAAVVVAALVALSAFVVDALRLTYVAEGCYVTGALVLAAVAVWGGLGVDRSRGGFWLRLATGGLYFGVATLCRSSCVLLLPGVALAVLAAARRRFSSMPSALAATAAGLLLFVAPYALCQLALSREVARTLAARGRGLEIPQRHAVWFALWTGLGDFDRTKGYVWEDAAASRVIKEHGGQPIRTSFFDRGGEPILRRLVLADIRRDPLWYLTILAKRLAVTVTQWKLLPWRPVDGVSRFPSGAPNEGQIDAYYDLAAGVDEFGFGPWRVELPLLPLLLPSWGLALAALLRCRGPRTPLDPVLVTLGALAVGLLTLPVLITTAGALETEAFALVYFVGLGLGADALARRARQTGDPASGA